MKQIPLNTRIKSSEKYGKYFALVDDEDFEFLNQWKWCTSHTKTIYAVRAIKENGKTTLLYMHRFIMGCKQGDGKVIDHIDYNGLNCQRNNLRICNTSQNTIHVKRTKGSSKYFGVSIRNKRYKTPCILWGAFISIDGKQTFLGEFKTEIEAAKVYNEAAIKHYGEFAKLNQL